MKRANVSRKYVRVLGPTRSFSYGDIDIISFHFLLQISETVQFMKRGGESFLIQKFVLQILDIYKGFFRTFSEKNNNIIEKVRDALGLGW